MHGESGMVHTRCIFSFPTWSSALRHRANVEDDIYTCDAATPYKGHEMADIGGSETIEHLKL